jgi:hypothetical protein
MRKIPGRFILSSLAISFTIAAGGCAAQTPVLTATQPAVIASPMSVVTATALPTNTLPPTQTATPLPPLTATATATTVQTATLTSVPSLTPTPAPSYNLPGLYTLGYCMRYGFNSGGQADGAQTEMCLISVQVNKDRSMQFNFTFRLVSFVGEKPHRYVFGEMIPIYLTDEWGNRYDPLYNSGKKPDRDENKDGVDTTAGWYMFPAPVEGVKLFTVHYSHNGDHKIGGFFLMVR